MWPMKTVTRGHAMVAWNLCPLPVSTEGSGGEAGQHWPIGSTEPEGSASGGEAGQPSTLSVSLT